MTYEAQRAAGAAGAAREYHKIISMRRFLTSCAYERVLHSRLLTCASLIHDGQVYHRHSPHLLPWMPPGGSRASPFPPWSYPWTGDQSLQSKISAQFFK